MELLHSQPISVEQLFQRLAGSGLIPSAELERLLDALPAHCKTNGEVVASHLVQQKKLTAFQAHQLCEHNAKPLVLGNYVLLDKLGQGGMGVVLKAEHRRMKRVVALKFLSPAITERPESLRRFQREVEVAAKLQHPNIVAAYDADESNGTHFLVMQYIDGTDLASLVRRNGPMSPNDALHCVEQAARGLEYAHTSGVVHRDVKPANLLLDRDGTLKVLDMGLARFGLANGENDSLTVTNEVMGTVDYLAPEQAMGAKTADARADVYSLGATLWYLLTGDALYKGDTAIAKLLAHQQQPIPSLMKACPTASPELETVFNRMVAKAPESRYQSMTEVITALKQCRRGDGAVGRVSEPSDTDGEQTERWRREPLPGTGSFRRSMQAKAPEKVAFSHGSEATVAFRSPQVDTHSETGQPLLDFVVPLDIPKTPRWPWRLSRTGRISAAGGAAILLLAAVFLVQTRDGAIRVEINDPQIEVAIKGTEIVLKQADQARRVKLSPGDHTLVVERGDFKFETDKLILKRGETVAVQVTLMADKVQARQGERLIGEGQLATSSHKGSTGPPKPAIAPFNTKQARQHQQEWAEYLKLPVEHTNSVGMKFILIPPGEFMMGSTPVDVEKALEVVNAIGEEEHWHEGVKSELPQHKVVLTQPIYLGAFEVTQAEYEAVMGLNPSYFSHLGEGKHAVAATETSRHPVETVSWMDATEFCAKLSQQEKLDPFYLRKGESVTWLDGTGYRLPTEAEWEFACRAGTTSAYWSGDTDQELERAGWFGANSGGRSHPVGMLEPNPLGLHDLHGNVWEWVQDAWEPRYYEQLNGTPAIDPAGASSFAYGHVVRGGFWSCPGSYCRSSHRQAAAADSRFTYLGFRAALSLRALEKDAK